MNILYTVVSYVAIKDVDSNVYIVDAHFAEQHNLDEVGPRRATRMGAYNAFVSRNIVGLGTPDAQCILHDCSVYECQCAHMANTPDLASMHGVWYTLEEEAQAEAAAGSK